MSKHYTKMKYLIPTLFLVLLVACSEKETPNGTRFKVIEKGDGKLGKPGEIIVFDYTLKDSKDSVWGETYSTGLPAAARIDDSVRIATEDGISQMLRMLSVGDSVSATMSVKDFFTKVVRGPRVPEGIDSTLNISYFFKVREITTEQQYVASRDSLVLARDKKKIKEFIAKNKMNNVQEDSTGLHYIIYNQEGKEKPDLNDCVEVKYRGYTMREGRVFDASPGLTYPLAGFIPGWKVGIPKLGAGDSATLFVPSGMAYGPNGAPPQIPGDAILIFDITLKSVKTFDPMTNQCK